MCDVIDTALLLKTAVKSMKWRYRGTTERRNCRKFTSLLIVDNTSESRLYVSGEQHFVLLPCVDVSVHRSLYVAIDLRTQH